VVLDRLGRRHVAIAGRHLDDLDLGRDAQLTQDGDGVQIGRQPARTQVDEHPATGDPVQPRQEHPGVRASGSTGRA